MTYKTAARQMHFREQKGSSSVRVTQRGYGGLSMQGEPLAILPTLKEQFETIKARAAELPKLIRSASTYEEAERLRKELGAKTAQVGDMRKTIYHATRVGFERIFLQVTRARLPDDLFLKFLAETQEIWEAEGYEEFVPPQNNQERRRASRKLAFREWRDSR